LKRSDNKDLIIFRLEAKTKMKDALKKTIQPYAARLISSDQILNLKRHLFEVKRKLLAKPHQVDVYLRIDDPYSYLLVQVLAEFEARFEIEIHCKTIKHLQEDMYPEVEMWHTNGFFDAGQLAHLYDLQWPQKAPIKSSAIISRGTECLLQLEAAFNGQSINWQLLKTVFEGYWFSQAEKFELSKEFELIDSLSMGRQLEANEMTLREKGHYMSAMLNYEGEWYWGLDRLDHLEQRLFSLGLGKDRNDEVYFNKTYVDLYQSKPLSKPDDRLKKLTLFFSIRSPYSHIGLEQAMKLAQHYQLELEVKPVLPMIMRGLSVPNTKKMYIFHDTKREAQKLGIDYGFVADPLGKGVERCYTLFIYAQSLGCEQQYLLNYAQAVNAQGIHSDTDAGLKSIVERSGMEWEKAQEILAQPEANTAWQEWAENNRQQMVALGSWGVPTFQYDDLVLWGQDRAGLIENRIKANLSTTE